MVQKMSTSFRMHNAQEKARLLSDGPTLGQIRVNESGTLDIGIVERIRNICLVRRGRYALWVGICVRDVMSGVGKMCMKAQLVCMIAHIRVNAHI